MGLEPGKVIKYAPIVDEALSMTEKIDNAKKFPRLIIQREELDGKHYDKDVDKSVYVDYKELILSREWEVAPCESLPSTHPLYILYTSGTTG